MAFKQSKVSDLEVKMSMLNYDRVLWRRMFEGQSRWHLSVRNRWELARWAVCFTSTIDVVISHNMCCWFFSLVFFFVFFFGCCCNELCVCVPTVSQYFSVLEDGALAHNLQEQESKDYESLSPHTSTECSYTFPVYFTFSSGSFDSPITTPSNSK